MRSEFDFLSTADFFFALVFAISIDAGIDGENAAVLNVY